MWAEEREGEYYLPFCRFLPHAGKIWLARRTVHSKHVQTQISGPAKWAVSYAYELCVDVWAILYLQVEESVFREYGCERVNGLDFALLFCIYILIRVLSSIQLCTHTLYVRIVLCAIIMICITFSLYL